jgi:hypothetical protein
MIGSMKRSITKTTSKPKQVKRMQLTEEQKAAIATEFLRQWNETLNGGANISKIVVDIETKAA